MQSVSGSKSRASSSSMSSGSVQDSYNDSIDSEERELAKLLQSLDEAMTTGNSA
ncbi:MAG TPA: hypothetical protein VGO47_13405 [Chlamydiales bacterium]|nr:hypothetical protein [Chlamydiales bacterium]